MPRLALRPLVLIAVLALMAVIVGAQAPVPQPEDQETAKVVVDLLERGHMARPVIDDEIAVKWCDNFIKDLDPGKYYFLKADVEEFKKEGTTLDDQIREGNIDFAKKVFDRFLQRQDERYKTSMELLKQKHDFTVDEYYQRRPGQDRLSRSTRPRPTSGCARRSSSTCSSPRWSTTSTTPKRFASGRSAIATATGKPTRSTPASCWKSICRA